MATDTPNPVSTSKIKGILSKKVAGVPVALLAVLFAGGLLFMAVRMRSTNESSTSLPDDTTDGGDLAGDVDPGDQPTFTARAATPVSVTGTSVTGVANADTNSLWAKRVSTWLQTQGYSYDQVQGMLSRFLSGESLTTEQDAIRTRAINQFGEPPEDVTYAPIDDTTDDTDTPDPNQPNVPDPPVTNPPPPGTTPEPPVTNPPPYTGPASAQGTPPCHHKVRGTSDDTEGELALLYYGSNGGTGKTQIRQANPGLDWTKNLPVGTSVKIPKLVDPKYFTATTNVRTSGAIAAKNGTDARTIQDLNPNMNFPVAAGTRVRVE